ncbi:MAG: hypothetical protein ACOYMA_09410 [Bacteroidia bacterium]
MKNLTLIGIIICGLSLNSLVSCNNSEKNNKISEKELELQKRELELKAKELELKEKELNGVSKSATISVNKEKPEQTNLSSSGYNYAGHSNFKTFWKDFKNAVNSGDKEAVLKMTKIPFIDKIEDAYNKSTSLTSKSGQKLLSNYDKIFTSSVKKAIDKNAYRGYEYNDFIGGDVINKGEYLLNVENNVSISNRETCDLVFVKVNGVFKLAYIPYYS